MEIIEYIIIISLLLIAKRLFAIGNALRRPALVLIIYGCMLLAAVLYLIFYSANTMVKLFGPLTISYFMTGLLAGLLLFVIGGIGYFVSQNVLKIPRPSEIQLYKKKGWARFGLSLVITLGPVLEEYVFRGVLLRHSGSIWMLVLLSTVIFSLYHLSLFQLTPTFLWGLGLAGITLVTRDLWTATIAHITFNLIGLILLSLDKLPQQSKD